MNTILIAAVAVLTIITIIFCVKQFHKPYTYIQEIVDKPEDFVKPNNKESGAENPGEQLIWDRAAAAIDKLNNDPDRTFCTRSVYGPEPEPEIDTDNMYTPQDTSIIETIDKNDLTQFNNYLTEEEADDLRQRPSADAPIIVEKTDNKESDKNNDTVTLDDGVTTELKIKNIEAKKRGRKPKTNDKNIDFKTIGEVLNNITNDKSEFTKKLEIKMKTNAKKLAKQLKDDAEKSEVKIVEPIIETDNKKTTKKKSATKTKTTKKSKKKTVTTKTVKNTKNKKSTNTSKKEA